jgi:predicted nucleotidyltransferase
VPTDPDRGRSLYLGPHDMHRLNEACRAIVDAFELVPYLVGSVATRRDYRDVDVRLIIEDEEFERRFADRPLLPRLLNYAFSNYLARSTGLPIDFQVQPRTEANAERGFRSALGIVPCTTCSAPPA